jgi:hypothetical protein
MILLVGVVDVEAEEEVVNTVFSPLSRSIDHE